MPFFILLDLIRKLQGTLAREIKNLKFSRKLTQLIARGGHLFVQESPKEACKWRVPVLLELVVIQLWVHVLLSTPIQLVH